MRRVICVLGVAVLPLTVSGTASAQPCDFLTGGGYIMTTEGAKANFGVGGGCKHGSPTWGHLNYIDHGTRLHVHWTSITAYAFVANGPPSAGGQPTGTRVICGTARTNQTVGEVDWAVTAMDNGEPGKNNDTFMIQVPELFYIEFGPLQGGNIELHKPNPSTSGLFSVLTPLNCPAFFACPFCGPD